MTELIYIDYAIRLLEAAKKSRTRRRKKTLYESDKGILGKIGDFFKSIWEKIKNFIRNVKEKIKRIWNNIFKRKNMEEEQNTKTSIEIEGENIIKALNNAEIKTLEEVKEKLENSATEVTNEKQAENNAKNIEENVENFENRILKLEGLFIKLLDNAAICNTTFCKEARKVAVQALKEIREIKKQKAMLYEGLLNKIRSGFEKVKSFLAYYVPLYIKLAGFMFIAYLGYEISKALLYNGNKLPSKYTGFLGVLQFIADNAEDPAVLSLILALSGTIIIVVMKTIKTILKRNNPSNNYKFE